MKFIKKPKKSLGQNFLFDKNIINKIVDIAKIEKNNSILEIGPGYGNLTKRLAQMNPNKIFAIEKDRKLISSLKDTFKDFKNIEIINDDFFNVIKNKSFAKNTLVFGNLPYNISTKILATFAMLEKWPPWFDVLIFMFQKEVADRIIAEKNSTDYGRLSILCNWRFNIKK